MDSLRGRTALVTGSTSGIGLGIAMSLAATGADVILNGFASEDEIKRLIREVESHKVRALYHGADLSSPSEIVQLMDFIRSECGGIDILVNNAGIQHVSAIEAFAPDKWDAVIAINLSAAFHTSRLALPGMRQKGWGRIVNIASAHGLVASVNKCAYIAAKHGLVGLTKAVALETARTSITVNAVCPGWVLTPLVQAQIEARAAAGGITVEAAKAGLLAEKQPSGEFVTPSQIGALVLFLCSESAAQVRGAAWNMDGGWTAQ